MKIAFPLLNEKELSTDFAHSKYIGIYDDGEGKTELVSLSDLVKDAGAVMIFESLAAQGLQLVASPFYSYLSLRVFKENNIITLKAVGKSLEENIRQFKASELRPFDVQESLLVGDCAKDCTSCGTSCSEN